MTKNEIPVVTPYGEGVIESLTISELNYLMVRVRYNDRWVNYTVDKLEEILNLVNIQFKSENIKTLTYEKESIN
jgi:hypothetical protein